MSTDSIERNGQLDSHGFGLAVERAQNGCRQSLGQVFGQCRDYLLAVANAECPLDLAGKVAPSDLVQDTLMEAQRDFGQFTGGRREQLLGWLNCILRNNMLNAIRHYRLTAARQVSREQSANGPSRGRLFPPLVEPSPGPRSWAIAQEESWLLEQALERLPDERRQVVMLRSWHQLSFAEVGLLMDRSPEAARKLWDRSIRHLQQELKGLGA